MSRTYLLRAYVGPVRVNEWADKLRAAGLDVTLEGTEHVYVNATGRSADGAAWDCLVDLVRKYGTDYGLRFNLWGQS